MDFMHFVPSKLITTNTYSKYQCVFLWLSSVAGTKQELPVLGSFWPQVWPFIFITITAERPDYKNILSIIPAKVRGICLHLFKTSGESESSTLASILCKNKWRISRMRGSSPNPKLGEEYVTSYIKSFISLNIYPFLYCSLIE